MHVTRLTPEAQALIDLGRKLQRAASESSAGSAAGDPAGSAVGPIDRIDQAIDAIECHRALSREQKRRGIAALKRAKARM